ncbi:hypothetical protein OQA88_1013 [Cercophora sp. LCS_1]
MKPVTIKEGTAAFLKDKLLFLSASFPVVQFLDRLIARDGPGSIRSKGGLAFPTEIWTMILEAVEELAKKKPEFILVKAYIAPESTPKKPALICTRHEFTLNQPNGERHLFAGKLSNSSSMRVLKEYLDNATPQNRGRINASSASTCKEIRRLSITYNPSRDGRPHVWHDSTVHIPKLRKFTGRENTWLITPPTTDQQPQHLYYDIDVPDVIRWIDGGNCSLCMGSRHPCFCPLCQEKHDLFEMQLGTRGWGQDTSTVCPMCVSWTLSRNLRERPEMFDRLAERAGKRLAELGYNHARFRKTDLPDSTEAQHHTIERYRCPLRRSL